MSKETFGTLLKPRAKAITKFADGFLKKIWNMLM